MKARPAPSKSSSVVPKRLERASRAGAAPSPSLWRVGGLLFVSGACALVYELAWIRELRLVFGSSTSASSAVLACFMGGLGLGGLRLGKDADRQAGSLRWYARLEAVVAVGAAVTPLLVSLARVVYVALGGTRGLGAVGGTALRLVLSAVVLGVPTYAMGGTLPAAVRAVTVRDEVSRRSIGLLYGLNAAGAVVGCAIATFVAFEALGTRALLWLACAANLAIAGLAYRVSPGAMSRGREGRGADRADSGAGAAMPAAALPATSATPTAPSSSIAPSIDAMRSMPAEPRAWRGLVLAACGVAGFVFCLLEIVWYRVLGPLLGGSVFAFGLILAAVLAGIAIGAALYGAIGRPARATLVGLAGTCLLEAIAVAAPIAGGDHIAVVVAMLRPLGGLGFGARAVEWGVVAGALVSPAAIVAGFQFPLLVAMLGRGAKEAGRDVGDAYACNTAGAIAGSLAGGFGLLPALGAVGCWRLAAGLLIALGVGAGAMAIAHERRGAARVEWAPFAWPAIAFVVAVVLVAARGPTAAWRQSPIGAGLVDLDRLRTPNDVRGWVLERRRAIDWEADGVESSIGVDSLSGVSFVVNGKNDGNARGDAATTVMLGLLGAFLHPHPQRSMVIGLGTGASAGWLAAVPSMTDVDVGELEPAVLEVARRSAPINHDAMDNRKMHVLLGDARETLLTAKAKYDVIASEPSNPYRAGVSSLFTREFYAAVADRLEDGGIFLQWLQAYEVDAQTVRTVYATMAVVFPQVETWHLKSDDLLLVASRRPIDWDVARLRARMTEPPFRDAFAFAWRTTELEGVLAHYVAGAATARRVADEENGAIATDDRNRIEFGFARALAGGSDFGVGDIRADARAHHDDVPPLRGGEVDWNLADEHVLAVLADEGIPIARSAGDEGPGRMHRAAALNAFEQNEFARVLGEWRAQPQEPVGPTQVAVVATALADAGAEAALRYIDTMRTFDAAEADVTLARLRFRRGAVDDAMRALEAGLVAYRRDPWPMPSLMLRAVAFSIEMLAREPDLAERMWHLLREPFTLRLADDVRKKVAAYAAGLMAPGSPCVEANRAFEPNPVWTLEFLTARARCYAAAGDPAASPARGDVDAFLRMAPPRFASDSSSGAAGAP